jgi:hypothetical protein
VETEMTVRDLELDPVDPGVLPIGRRLTFSHPEELVGDSTIRIDAKRALLADWASDRHAVEGALGLRQLDSGAIVRLDDIISALKSLDRGATALARPSPNRRALRRLLRRPFAVRRRAVEPDDDPSPGPVRMRLRRFTQAVGAGA